MADFSTDAEAATRRDPRLFYVNLPASGDMAGWERKLSDVAALGFNHVVLPAPFAAADPRLLDDPERSEAPLAALDSACRAAGLGWLIDVRIDAVAADGSLARAHADLFEAPPPWAAIDPTAPETAARARDAAGFENFWAGLLQRWQAAGAAGFRLGGLTALPARKAAELLARIRLAEAETILIGEFGQFPIAGLDRVELAIDRWDDAAASVLTRAEFVTRTAPVLAVVERPFGPRLAARYASRAEWIAAVLRVVHLAGALGDGWLLTEGFATGETLRMDARAGWTGDAAGEAPPEIVAAIRAANAPQGHYGPPARVPEVARGIDGLVRRAEGHARMTLVNHGAAPATLRVSDLAKGYVTETGMTTTLAAGEARSLDLTATPLMRQPPRPRAASAAAHAESDRLGIEAVTPSVDGGRFAAKRVAGDVVAIECDIICDGHDQLAAIVQWRAANETAWRETRMAPLGNDRWQASIELLAVGRWIFRIVAWRDAYATFHDELTKKHRVGLDVSLEVREGRKLIEDAVARESTLADALALLDAAPLADQVAILLSPDVTQHMRAADARPFFVESQDFPIDADRPQAAFASWYEIFPRSMSGDGVRHGTFRDVIAQLPRIRDMGFDVLYFPPIHPIGRIHRKGRNNSLTPAADDPGSPYAIGSAEGGHDALHPELGSFGDFEEMRREAAAMGLEIAIDFAIQCSPDHPWLTEHKGWFDWRPDGSLRYAENPPKKYEDIVNVDFYAPDAVPDLWLALADVVFFWLERGVRIFRVDNPHTKPFPFWEWLINEVRFSYPDAIFLAEAFTRPKVMNRLGKIGFHQSYTYFTWRNTKYELQEYLTQISAAPAADFFRPNFFVNTPDINPVFLQNSGRAGFLIRAALAAILSGSWGVYCGFELCEATPVPGKEEYLDSEKYQLRAWDWDRPGNIVAEITQLNAVRRLHPCLWTHLGVTFLASDDDQVLFFEKATADRGDVLLIAICLDPRNAHSAAIEIPLWRWGLSDQAAIECRDVLHDTDFTLTGKWQRVALSPDAPYTIWRARPQGPYSA